MFKTIRKKHDKYGTVILNVYQVKKLLKHINPLYVYQEYYDYDEESEYMAITKVVFNKRNELRSFEVSYINAENNEEDTMYVSKTDTHFELICNKEEFIKNFKLLSAHDKMSILSKAPFTLFDE